MTWFDYGVVAGWKPVVVKSTGLFLNVHPIYTAGFNANKNVNISKWEFLLQSSINSEYIIRIQHLLWLIFTKIIACFDNYLRNSGQITNFFKHIITMLFVKLNYKKSSCNLTLQISVCRVNIYNHRTYFTLHFLLHKNVMFSDVFIDHNIEWLEFQNFFFCPKRIK